MKAALQMLGYPRVHHAYELYVHPEQCEDWAAAWKAKCRGDASIVTPGFWNKILGDYDAVTDMPAVCFSEVLIQAYPQAKVILTQRDEAAWFKSFNAGVIETYWDNAGATAVMGMLDHKLMRPVHVLWTLLFARRDGYFRSTTREEMQDSAVGAYRRHNQLVMSFVAADRLLVFDMRDGWSPLCKFLGVPMPSVPFPRVNEGNAVKEVIASFMKRSVLRILWNLAMVVVPVSAAMYWLL